MSEPADSARRDFGQGHAWIWRTLVGGLAAAGTCGGIWYITGAPHPAGTIACDAIAAVATGWAAARSPRAGVFMFLICFGATLTVVSFFPASVWFGGSGIVLPLFGAMIVLGTIRAWMKSEGYI